MNLWKYRLAQLVSSARFNRKASLSGRSVLMYHSIGENKQKDLYTLSEQFFSDHVALLNELSQSELLKTVELTNAVLSGVSITFDDGYADTLTTAAPLLCKNNLPFTVFVTPQNVLSGDRKYLTKSQLVELSKLPGVTIGGHGFSHNHLATISISEAQNELNQSKAWLEDSIGKSVDSMSYPHGSYNSDVVKIAGDVGFKFAATSDWGRFDATTELLSIPRIDVWNYDSRQTLHQKLSGKWDWAARLI
jgi:peptidoglycan/xylan/chitin deacetylase (PgdA/CDA1 family)